MVEIGIVIIIGIGAIGAAAYAGLTSKPAVANEPLPVLEDFRAIKRALGEFKKENINKMENILQLARYLEAGKRVNLKRYEISEDERYLILKDVGKMNCQPFIDAVGGASRLEGGSLYLSFFKFKVSEVEPKAAIFMAPHVNITTTTSIEWSSQGSVAEGNEIRHEEWEGNKEIYSEPGRKTVRLRIQDRNENWSEWTEVHFEVTEIGGINGIQAGMDFLMILHNSGKVEAFGGNKFGQLGNGGQSTLKEKTFISSYENIEQIACGETHVLAKDYTGKVYGCGSNDFGQLGSGNRLNSRTPQKIWGLEKVKQLAAGKDFSGAVLMTGAVLTWGTNDFGQLGDEKPMYQELPKRVRNLSNVRQLALGQSHALALLYDGSVVAWGDNNRGQLGSGYKGKSTDLVTVNIKGVKQVAAGKDFSVALLENGKVLAWGNNNVGQCGFQNESELLFPREIPKLKGIVKLAVMNSFVLALTEIGGVYTWGCYDTECDVYYNTPLEIDGLKYIRDIAASYTTAYVLTEQEEILTWSDNIDIRMPLEDSLVVE